VNRQVAEDQETLQSDQLKKRREFLLEDIRAEEENSDKRLELQGELYKLNADLEKALAAERKEAAEKEKERQDELAEKEEERLRLLKELNQEYLDNLTAQYDESGIIRLKQQERDAIAEATALGASQRDLLRIREYYANERKKIAQKIDDDIAKEDEKRFKKAVEVNKKRLEDYFDQQIEIMKESADTMSSIFSNFSTLLDELGNISQARFERQIGQLREERDIIRGNDALTKEEKEPWVLGVSPRLPLV
jgi:hypothetical protein